jgi:predicted ATP-dependent endonuclease of OLD family
MQSPKNLAGKGLAKKPLIKNLKVKNFTCFKDLELTNCGHVNLLLADNGCGKTNLLRAIDLVVARCKDAGLGKNEQHTELGKSVMRILDETNSLPRLNERRLPPRQITPKDLKLFVNFYNPQEEFTIDADLHNDETTQLLATSLLAINLKSCIESCVESSRGLWYDYYEANEPVMHSLYPETQWKNYINSLYDFTTDPQIEDLLKKMSESIVSNLTNVRGHATELIKFFLEGDVSTTLGWQGYGLKKMVTIALLVLYNKNSAVIIDEVDNGLHYNRYEDFAKMILKSAELANTQVFITTHSREFAKVFLQTAAEFKKPDSDITFNEDVKTYRLYKKDNGVVAADYGNATASLDEIGFNDSYFTRDV